MLLEVLVRLLGMGCAGIALAQLRTSTSPGPQDPEDLACAGLGALTSFPAHVPLGGSQAGRYTKVQVSRAHFNVKTRKYMRFSGGRGSKRVRRCLLRVGKVLPGLSLSGVVLWALSCVSWVL